MTNPPFPEPPAPDSSNPVTPPPTAPPDPPAAPPTWDAGPGAAPAAGYAAHAAPAYPQPEPSPPGRVLSIVGLVLAFVAAPIGLILSIVAAVKLGKAGQPKGLAIAGIVVGEPARHREAAQRKGFGQVARSIWGPFQQFFTREGALIVLLFILVHKLGDTLSQLTVRLLSSTSWATR